MADFENYAVEVRNRINLLLNIRKKYAYARVQQIYASTQICAKSTHLRTFSRYTTYDIYTTLHDIYATRQTIYASTQICANSENSGNR